MFTKLQKLKNKFEEIQAKLADGSIFTNIDDYKALRIESAKLEPIIAKYDEYLATVQYKAELNQWLALESNAADRQNINQELAEVEQKINVLIEELKQLLLMESDTEAEKTKIILEIRAGVGGDEACLFAQDLFNMYIKYCNKQNWKYSVISCNDGTVAGIKEIVIAIDGACAYQKLKYENGVHRVQRVPETEANGRIHTSTATVVVFPEQVALDFTIDQKDLKFDLFHSSGKGGQNVNKVETAVRVTHIPTGIVVACQEERSQLQNKERALAILQAKVYDYYNTKLVNERMAEKSQILGTGDRSEKIRTYNYVQHRVTDHRINYTMYNMEAVLQGDLAELIEQLQIAEKAKRLSENK